MEKEDTIIPLLLRSCLMTFNIRVRTDEELAEMTPVILTDENPWNPKEHDDVDETYYANAIEHEDDISEIDNHLETDQDSVTTIAIDNVQPSLKE
eukprot:scaffold97397_cov35-Attheya_sp.AAC.2